MRKNVLVILIVTFAIVAVSAFAACSVNIDGNAYLFSSVQVRLLNAEDGEQEELKAAVEEAFADSSFSFENGTASFGWGDDTVSCAYTQSGSALSFQAGFLDEYGFPFGDAAEVSVSGNKLTISASGTYEGYSAFFSFVFVRDASLGGSSGEQGGQGGDQGGDQGGSQGGGTGGGGIDKRNVNEGFDMYIPAEEIILHEGERLTPVTDAIASDPLALYEVVRENQRKVSGYAQVTTTASQISVHVTSAQGVFSIANGRDLDIVQYASWMRAEANGSYYDQTISQMDKIGISFLESLTSLFGVWSKSSYNAATDIYSYQEGDMGSMTSDKNAPAGITATWLGTPETWHSSEVTYNESQAKFDKTVRVTSNVDGADYKVYTGDDEKLGEFRSSINSKNLDDEGNKVIYVEFRGSDGNFGAGSWYVWDDQEGTADGRYVGFVRDRHFKALPERGDGISNFIVNEDTLDMRGSSVEKRADEDGNVYYVLDIKLRENLEKGYSWELITSGELANLQGGIIDFVAFDTEHGGFQPELTLRYEIWDTGVIKRVVRNFSIATDDQDGSGPTAEQAFILGAVTAYGGATFDMTTDYAYGGATLNLRHYAYRI